MKFLNSRTRETTLWVLLLCFIILSFYGCNPPVKKEAGNNHVINSSPLISDLLLGDSLFDKALYDSAFVAYKNAADYFEKEKNWENLTGTLLKISDIQRLKGNIKDATITINKAEHIVNKYKVKNLHIPADVFHKRGLLLLDQGHFDSAIDLFNQSIKCKTEYVRLNDTSLSMNYNALGTAYFYKHDYDNALENYSLAYKLALRRKHPEDTDLAMFVQNMGIIYAQKGDYEKAEDAFTSSLIINEKLLKPDDPELSMINLNVGRLKALLNKDAESLTFYNKAEEIMNKKSDPGHPYYIYIYLNKGQTYVHLADYEKALLYFNKALALATASLDKKHPQILSLNMNIGYVYEKKGDFANALRFYRASMPAGNEDPSLIKTYSNLASLYNSMNDPAKANECYTKALKLAEKSLGANHPETGLLYTRYGYFLLQHPSRIKAFDYFNKALTISLKHYGPKSREVSNNYTHIGNYYYTLNQTRKALDFYQKAIISIVTSFNDKNISSNPDIKIIEADRYLVNALHHKADALALLGSRKNLVKSLETYRLSVKVINKLRSTYQDEESKLLISGEEKSTFQKTVDVAVKLFRMSHDEKYLAIAFEYADKSKSAVLINSMRDVEAQHFGQIPEEILSLERKLKLNISSFRRFIYEEKQKPAPDQGKINGWESKVFDFTVRYDSLVNFLEVKYPDYYKLKYSEPTVSIKAIQNQLENDRALVEYMLSDSMLTTFVINKYHFKVFTQPINSTFKKDIQVLAASTTNNSMMSPTEQDYAAYTGSAYRLYKILIQPIEYSFHEKKLIIIPDGEIGYISFDMLLTKPVSASNMDYRKLPYLIRNKVISYSTSAILQYSGFQKRERKATRNLLAIAPSYENLTDSVKTAFTDENGKKVYLLPIPGIEKELKGIKHTLSAKTIEGKDATEERFKKEVGKYNILHLAMHTLINNSEPMLSKLVFYQDNDTLEDGMLNTYELFNMDLNAGLAVLSACNTGSGKLLKGEGIMNLARGFIYAGVPGIVMTMWSVEDQASSDIVNKFYKYLKDGMSKDEALRQAKLDFLAQGDPLKSHPFYWAAYVNIGDNSPMKLRNHKVIYSIAGVSLLIIGIGLLFVIKRKNIIKYK